MRRLVLQGSRAAARLALAKSPNRSFSTSVTRPFATSAADVQFGQPLHETHPHLLQPGELTPGISALEYHHRRAALARKLPKNSVAILAAADVKWRSHSVFYQYHQEPNFYYLTGFLEPEALAVIEKGESDVEYTFHLFVRPKDARAELWDGARSGVQAAYDVFNADEADSVENIANALPNIIKRANAIYTDLGTGGKQTSLNRFLHGPQSGVAYLATRLGHSIVRPLKDMMNAIRMTKSEAEIECMRKAGKESGLAYATVMAQYQTTERDLWNDLSYTFRKRGLEGDAYVPVIGGGQNALSIHYVRNDAALEQGDMVLVDAGGLYGGYITDITRTWPVNPRFSDAQRDMYNMILAVQKSCISLCREDADMNLDRLHRVAENGLRTGLKDLGFDLSGNAFEVLFPHHLGHYIGLDVHDAPGFARNSAFKENHCITVEPGIYVPNDDRWPVHFRGLGIRIEDSIRVGAEAPEVLTSTAPKEAEEIEALRSGV